MDNFKKIALKAALDAEDILKKNFGKRHKIGHKGEIDLVTEIDIRSEQRIIKILKKEFPDHDILAEEGKRWDRKAEYRWIIDPLDGTTNYAHGFPCFSVSIALERRG